MKPFLQFTIGMLALAVLTIVLMTHAYQSDDSAIRDIIIWLAFMIDGVLGVLIICSISKNK